MCRRASFCQLRSYNCATSVSCFIWSIVTFLGIIARFLHQIDDRKRSEQIAREHAHREAEPQDSSATGSSRLDFNRIKCVVQLQAEGEECPLLVS